MAINLSTVNGKQLSGTQHAMMNQHFAKNRDGVFRNYGNAFSYSQSGNVLTINTGAMLVDGRLVEVDAPVALTVTIVGVSYVVMQVNLGSASANLIVKQQPFTQNDLTTLPATGIREIPLYQLSYNGSILSTPVDNRTYVGDLIKSESLLLSNITSRSITLPTGAGDLGRNIKIMWKFYGTSLPLGTLFRCTFYNGATPLAMRKLYFVNSVDLTTSGSGNTIMRDEGANTNYIQWGLNGAVSSWSTDLDVVVGARMNGNVIQGQTNGNYTWETFIGNQVDSTQKITSITFEVLSGSMQNAQISLWYM